MTCGRCHKSKAPAAFNRDKNRRSGRYPYCKACRRMARLMCLDGPTPPERRVAHRRDPVDQMLAHARARAKRKGVEFMLCRTDVVVPKACPALGIQLMVGEGRFGPNSPTLDRLDPTLGYVPGNVAVLSFRANLIKNNATPEEVMAVAMWMSSACKNSKHN